MARKFRSILVVIGLATASAGAALVLATSAHSAAVTPVVPQDPTVTQAHCNGTAAVDPVVTLATTAGITYSIAPAPAAGGASTVTATADLGSAFIGAAPAGWTYNDATHATFTINFAAQPTCAATVVPVDPIVTQAHCSGDVSVGPIVALPSTIGITYSIAPPPVAGSSSTVTATANAGNQFVTPAPTGWVFVDSTHETFTINFIAATDCGVPPPPPTVTPIDPSVSDPTCTGSPSHLKAPKLVLAHTAGITYTVSAPPPYVGGQTVIVTATAKGSNIFVTAPAGWTLVDAHHETFSNTFASSPTCGGTGLANTGVKSGQLLEFGGVTLLVGIGLQLMGMGRRRRSTL